MITQNKMYKKNTSLEVEDLGDGSIMIYNENEKLTCILNDIMADIWNECDGTKNIDDILKKIILSYEVTDIDIEEMIVQKH